MGPYFTLIDVTLGLAVTASEVGTLPSTCHNGLLLLLFAAIEDLR